MDDLKKSAGHNCSTTVKKPAQSTSPPVVRVPSSSIQEYEVHVGDQLDIKFSNNSERNEQVTVRPDGRISLQLANEVMTAGLTSAELTDIFTEINCGRGDFSRVYP
jgi:protein involved in polysaccharide export with SLBB domain